MKKVLLLLLTVCLMICCAQALAETEGDWTYSVDRYGVATLTGYIGRETSLVLPESLGGYEITAVGQSAFAGNTAIKKVVIPDCYTTIGARAFENCTRIASLSLGGGISTWGKDWGYGGAFAGCVNLFEVDFAHGITSIGHAAFKGCTLLDAIYLPDSVTLVEDAAFEDCELLDIADVYGNIGSYAFHNCSYMSQLTIRNAGSIGAHAFQGCTSLKDVELPATLTSIGGEAFRSCNKLRAIVIPDSVTSLGYRAFMDCLQLKQATVGSGVQEWPTDWGDSSVFNNCPALVNITVRPGVTHLPEDFVKNCRSLKEVNLPEGLVSLGDSMFVGCASLETILFPSTLETIGNYTFDGCALLKEAVLPESLISIGSSSFRATALTEVIIPNNCTDIGCYAFQNCESLKHVTLGEFVSNWWEDWGHNGAFENCVNLETLVVENGVNSIGTYAFRNCPKLQTVEIPSTSVCVGEYAFADCTGLQDVTVYRGVIENNAFENCSALQSLTIRKVTAIGDNAFRKCVMLSDMELPRTLLSLGRNAFSGCASLTEIVIPDSTTSFGCYAFENCTGLKTVYVGNNISEWVLSWSEGRGFNNCSALEYIYFADGLTAIPEGLLMKCIALKGVYIPASVGSFGNRVMDSVPPTCVIYGESGSAAETFALENGFTFSTGDFPVVY